MPIFDKFPYSLRSQGDKDSHTDKSIITKILNCIHFVPAVLRMCVMPYFFKNAMFIAEALSPMKSPGGKFQMYNNLFGIVCLGGKYL
jgi:hypothetical protein